MGLKHGKNKNTNGATKLENRGNLPSVRECANGKGRKETTHPSIGMSGLKFSLYMIHSTKPYFTLIRSSFSNIGSAATMMKITVAAAWIKSIGRPVT